MRTGAGARGPDGHASMTPASPAVRGRFFTRRRVAVTLLGVLGVAALVVASALVLVATIDLRPLLERYATWTLERRLTVGTLRIGWRNPLSVEMTDFRLANAAWGSGPAMVRIESLSAELDVLPLLRGVLRFQKLDVMKPEIVLERDADGTGNWRFGGAGSPPRASRWREPSGRTGFPTLIDFRLRDGTVTYRTSSGAVLRGDLHDLTIRSAGDDRPVSLALEGAYNGTPVRLEAATESFAVLRTRSAPFGMELSAATPTAEVGFKGTMTEPLDFDGALGPLRIDARRLGDFLNIFGADVHADIPLRLVGAFSRAGDRWHLADAKGTLANDDFGGDLTLTEAGRGQPDEIGIAAAFAHLHLDPILAGAAGGRPGRGRAAAKADYGALSLELEAKRGTNFDATIAAALLEYRAMRVADFRVRGRLASGELAVERLTFSFAGGTVDASGSARGAGPGSRVVANASVSGANAGLIATMLGAEGGQIAGSLAGGATLAMTGATVREAFKTSRGHVVLAMKEGRIARAALERVSTDLRSLIRRNELSTPISCFLGVIALKDGNGTISPLNLQTPAAVLVGGGQVDFPERRLDMVVKSVAASTSFFALDIPLRVSGEFAHLSVGPLAGASAGPLDAAAASNAAQPMPPGLQRLADDNPCPR